MSTQAVHRSLPTKKALIGGKFFDTYFIVTVLWLVAGIFADSWAHNHIAKLETFFTPWHAVLYSGLLAFIVGFLAVVVLNRIRGAGWHEAIPQGYRLSFIGMGAMILVGLGDMTWHVLFGVEQNLDALFSPTHLAGMICTGLIMGGPYLAMYQRRTNPSTLGEKLLLVAAFTILLIVIMNESQGASIFTTVWPVEYRTGQDTGQLAGVLSFVFEGLLFTGFTLYTIRRWKLFPGFFTIFWFLISGPMSLMQDRYLLILVCTLAGIIIDIAYHFLQPSLAHPFRFRAFSVICASTLFAVYNIAIALTDQVVWTVHMEIGSVVVVGILAWLFSYLVLPSKQLDLPPDL